jgi:hypothetical protein
MKSIFTALIILSILLLSPVISLADGYSIKPGIKEYTLSPGQIRLGEILFRSNEKKDTRIAVTVETYDPKTESILNKKPFVSVGTGKYTVKAGKEISIEYALSIPEDTPVGSYFNIVTVTEDRKGSSEENTVGVKKAVGSIIAMHVIDSDKSIEAIFFDQGATSLKVTNKGFPFLSATRFEYSYENKSNFVFRPEGEIRIIDQQGKQVSQRFEINPDKGAVYPGDIYTESFEVDQWDMNNVFQTKDIIAKTYSGYGDNSITDKVTLNLRNSIYALGATGAVLVISLLVLIVRAVRMRLNPSKKS